MAEPDGPLALVSVDIVNKPVVFPDRGALGQVTFNGPASAGITVAVASSNPNILSVDSPTVDADPGTDQSVLFFLTPQALGTAVITATLGNSVQTEVTVEKNPKEGKEGKEGKETAKEGKEHHKELEVSGAHGSPATKAGATSALNLDGDGQAGNRRAFIRFDERPALRLRVN